MEISRLLAAKAVWVFCELWKSRRDTWDQRIMLEKSEGDISVRLVPVLQPLLRPRAKRTGGGAGGTSALSVWL
jgi:hypothetical protein